MLKVENLEVMNLKGAIRGARNPMNSWDRIDSYEDENGNYVLGPNDLSLAKRLRLAGPDHRKYLRQILISCDITAPIYWWKEFDTYKVGTVANSTSTMHKITSKPIEISDFSVDDFFCGDAGTFRMMFERRIADCEYLREKYLETKDRKYWRGLIQLLPEAYNQRRTVTMNYENCINMYFARKDHKLSEWHTFCDEFIAKLPYAEDLIFPASGNPES